MSNTSQCKIIPVGAGESFWTLGDLITFKIGPEQTNNQWSLAETTVVPGGGPPPHVHQREDETFYLLEGEAEFLLEDNVYLAKPGDAFFLPRGKVHTFRNPSKTRAARMLVMASPCGFEKFMLNFARPKSESVDPPPVRKEDVEKLMAVAPNFGIELKFDHKPKNAPQPAKCVQRSLRVMDLRIDLQINSVDCNGAFSLVTISAPPGAAVPMHLHREQDEVFYVIDGKFQFDLDTGPAVAEAGATVFLPKRAMHGFKNVGTKNGKLANLHLPGGFEHFFIEIGHDFDASEPAFGPPPDIAELTRICDKHGMELPR